MAPPLLHLRDIHLTFGGTPLLEGAELSVSERDRLCLVGRNGSGKSTLLKIAAGLIEPDSGEVFVQPGSTVRYLSQEPDFAGFSTTLAYVEAGLGPDGDSHRAQALLGQLGLDGTENLRRLSGGEARRTALARTLAPAPDILLLDEPTNHLDLPAIEWLESELKSSSAALVLISHDRRFLETLSRTTVWLSAGKTRRLDDGFGAFEEWRDGILEREAVEQHKLDRKIAAETVWLRQGVTARRKRNQGRLRALHQLRAERRAQRQAVGTVDMSVSTAARSGRRAIDAEAVSKSFDGKPVIRDFSIRVQRGDRIGIVGPNGAGKTTLLNLLTGALPPDTGTVRHGANLDMVTIDQRRESLDPATRLVDALTGGTGDTVSVGGKTKHVIAYMKDFLFSPEQARTPIGALSGGERGRLMLARALAQPSNLLVLDEPTNDLDIETLDLLQEMLADHPGTVLLVSHDRDFLDHVVTSLIAFEGDGRWVEYAGGYTDMLAQRGGTLEEPHAAKAPSRKSRDKPARANAPAAKRKLSFKDQHALQTLPARIEALEAEVATQRSLLADPGLFTRDPDAFKKVAAELERAEAALAVAEEQWLTLEMAKEEFEGDAE
jgi:ATP-binding cassette subfamily F protein uup